MTFIDPAYPPPTPGLITAYALLTVTSLLCAARAFHLGKTRSHYRYIYTVRFLFPLSCVALALENATLASSGRFYGEDGLSDSQTRFLGFVYACQALEVPILLVATFELTYLVHKRRSVNFCGMYFDEGRRVREQRMVTNTIKSFVLRNFIRAIAIVLLAMGIVVNFDLLGNADRIDELAGRCGWVCLFTDGRSWDEKTHMLLSLIPTAVLIVCNSYFSFLLWRYGTEFSMVVHASILNPWFSLSVGNAALAAGQIFGYPPHFPFTSNLGLIVFIVSILLLMAEVDKDMVAADEFADFLGQVARKGDQFSVVGAASRKRVEAAASAAAPAAGSGTGEGSTTTTNAAAASLASQKATVAGGGAVDVARGNGSGEVGEADEVVAVDEARDVEAGVSGPGDRPHEGAEGDGEGTAESESGVGETMPFGNEDAEDANKAPQKEGSEAKEGDKELEAPEGKEGNKEEEALDAKDGDKAEVASGK